MDVQLHLALVELDDSIRMSSSVVEEVASCFLCVFGALGLAGGQGTEGNKHGVIDCSAVK